MFALFRPDDRRQDIHPRALRELENLLYHLIDALPLDGFAAFGAVRHARPGIENAQIILNFRYRAHGGTRVSAGGFLVDGDGGGEPCNIIHVWLFHLPQKLAGIGGERFHIPPLAFGIDGIESQGGFAAARKPRDDDELISGQVHADVF